MSLRTVSPVSRRRTLALAALAACLAAAALAAPAQAGFVHALGSPFPTATPPRALDVADVDGNGVLDVAAGGLAAGGIALHLGDGSGWIGSTRPLGLPGPVLSLAGGDLDGDGLRDYAALVPGEPRRLVVHRAQQAGGHAATTVLADAGDALDVEIANVDAGGPAELLVAEGGTVTVLRAVGDAFVAGDPIATGAAGSLTRIAAAHLDGDGRVDLVGADGGGAPAVVALRGDGTGGFAPLGRRATGLPAASTAVAAADFDGDGRVDAVAGAPGGHFAVLRGDGAGGLAPMAGSPFPAGGGSAAIDDLVASDFNRDGQPDVVAANRDGSISVLLNSDTGLLAAAPAAVDFGELPAGSPPQALSLALTSTRGRLHVTRDDLHGSTRFEITGGDCVGRTLLLGQACSLAVTFTPPRRAADFQALLSVDANAAAVVVPVTATIRPPAIASALVRPRRVRPARRLALRYELSETARVRVGIERAAPGRIVGRRAGRRCVPPHRRNLERRRCRLWQPLGAFARRGAAGPNRLRLRARARRRPLEPGLHRLALTAVDRYRNRSEPTYVPFRVRRAPKRPRRQAARRALK